MNKDYIWLNKNHERKNMHDMTAAELQEAHDHCYAMLYNNEKNRKGRYYIIKELQREIDSCNAEIAVRWFVNINDGKDYSRYRLANLITNLQIKDQEGFVTDDQLKMLTLGDMFDRESIPADFRDLNLFVFRRACQGFSGKFNTYNFKPEMIQKIGVKFSGEENKHFDEIGFHSLEEKLEYAQEELHFKKLFLSHKGLTIAQYKNILSISKFMKYEDMESSTLFLLRDKVIFELIEIIKKEISVWENVMQQLEEVAAKKEIKLT